MARTQVSIQLDPKTAERIRKETESLSGYISSVIEERVKKVDLARHILAVNNISNVERRTIADELSHPREITGIVRRVDKMARDVVNSAELVTDDEKAGRSAIKDEKTEQT